MNRLFRWILPVLILAGASGIALLLVLTGPDVPAEPAEERAWPVATVTATVAAHRPLVRMQGFLESPRTAGLTAAVEGDVAELQAREGDQVEEGGALVRLDDRELRLTLTQQEADVADLESQRRTEQRRIEGDRQDLALEQELEALLEREVERLRDLSRDQYASPSQLEQAEQQLKRQRLAVAERQFAVDTAQNRLDRLDAGLDRARALRDRAALDLSRAEVRAPFAGRVAEVAVSPGDRVRPGEPLVTLYDTEALEVRATVPRQVLAPLRLALAGSGVDAHATVDGETVPVSLSRFSGRAERGQGGVDALFRVNGGGDGLVLGRFATLEMTLPPEPDTVLLPFEALYDAGRIYRVRDGRMEAVDVTRVGQARHDSGRRGVLVRAAELETGDAIVATQIPQAMDGLRVQVLEQ
ncbi:HlyD family efflux transporter periplasmic adaptor subunit [Aquisalimonas sp.]|uniref:efflux RND transporter periplasmic adaptor subunit n=1 Tax=unclassified Aquisalimonas TaxID=2644645 RepID=UPI0025BAABE4|nr:HlyD family efflux transporter periplasmic adaptor subunit [Aquisalimonas sp.]